MKIFQEIATHEDLRDTLGTKFALLFFSGAIPESVEELPFNESDSFFTKFHSAEAVSEIVHTYFNVEHTASKFNHVNASKTPGIFKVNASYPGLFEMLNSPEYSKPDYFTPEQLIDIPNQSDIRIGNASASGEFFEYNMKEAFVLKSFSWEYTTSRSYAPEAKLQVHDGSDWVDLYDFSRYEFSDNPTKELDLSDNSISSDRYRVLSTSVATSYTYLPSVKFFTDVEPSSNGELPLTWAAMIPMIPSTSAEPNPILWAEVGGPNDGKDIAIQDANPTAGKGITVMNFKIRVNTLGDIK